MQDEIQVGFAHGVYDNYWLIRCRPSICQRAP